jgi:hypothetical protein
VIGIKEKKKSRAKSRLTRQSKAKLKKQKGKKKKKTTISRPNVCPRRIYKNEMARKKNRIRKNR